MSTGNTKAVCLFECYTFRGWVFCFVSVLCCFVVALVFVVLVVVVAAAAVSVLVFVFICLEKALIQTRHKNGIIRNKTKSEFNR